GSGWRRLSRTPGRNGPAPGANRAGGRASEREGRTVSVSRRLLLRAVTVSGAGGAVLPVAACATPGGAPAAPAGGGGPAGPASVTVTFPGGGSEDDDFKPVFEAFAQKYPQISATWTPGGTGGYNDAYTEKLTGLFAAGSGPDVFKTTDNFGSF